MTITIQDKRGIPFH